MALLLFYIVHVSTMQMYEKGIFWVYDNKKPNDWHKNQTKSNIFPVKALESDYTLCLFLNVDGRVIVYNCLHPLHLNGNGYILVSLEIIPHLFVCISTGNPTYYHERNKCNLNIYVCNYILHDWYLMLYNSLLSKPLRNIIYRLQP